MSKRLAAQSLAIRLGRAIGYLAARAGDAVPAHVLPIVGRGGIRVVPARPDDGDRVVAVHEIGIGIEGGDSVGRRKVGPEAAGVGGEDDHAEEAVAGEDEAAGKRLGPLVGAAKGRGDGPVGGVGEAAPAVRNGLVGGGLRGAWRLSGTRGGPGGGDSLSGWV